MPVAVSYEFDPCDQQKAQELYDRAEFGEYKKSQFEDIESIVRGITWQKGRVHVAFGQPLKGELSDAEAVAKEIDRQIYKNYHLHSSNFIAAKQDLSSIDSADKELFDARLQGVKPALQEIVLKMYANPVYNHIK